MCVLCIILPFTFIIIIINITAYCPLCIRLEHILYVYDSYYSKRREEEAQIKINVSPVPVPVQVFHNKILKLNPMTNESK